MTQANGGEKRACQHPHGSRTNMARDAEKALLHRRDFLRSAAAGAFGVVSVGGVFLINDVSRGELIDPLTPLGGGSDPGTGASSGTSTGGASGSELSATCTCQCGNCTCACLCECSLCACGCSCQCGCPCECPCDCNCDGCTCSCLCGCDCRCTCECTCNCSCNCSCNCLQCDCLSGGLATNQESLSTTNKEPALVPPRNTLGQNVRNTNHVPTGYGNSSTIHGTGSQALTNAKHEPVANNQSETGRAQTSNRSVGTSGASDQDSGDSGGRSQSVSLVNTSQTQNNVANTVTLLDDTARDADQGDTSQEGYDYTRIETYNVAPYEPPALRVVPLD